MYDVDYDKNTSYNLLTIIARLFITSECENKLKNALHQPKGKMIQ